MNPKHRAGWLREGLGVLTLALVVGCGRETRRVRTAATPDPQPAAISSHSSRLTLSRDEALAAVCDLYAQLDVDCDKRLTVLDQRNLCAHPPCAISHDVTLGQHHTTVTTLHQASQLAIELAQGLSADLKTGREREKRPPSMGEAVVFPGRAPTIFRSLTSYTGRGSQVLRPALSHDAPGDSTVSLDLERVFQNPVDYLAAQIERRYWSGLTRTISASETELRKALADEKQSETRRPEQGWCQDTNPACLPPARQSEGPSSDSSSSPGVHYLYVPEADATAMRTYAPLQRTMRLRVEQVPSVVSPEWVTNLTRNKRHGLLTLAHDTNGNALPFVVPGGRFNEMYGWDSYFIAWGLLESGKLSLARAMAEHQAYEIVHYGKVLNANRTYYLTRSQPPFFAALVRKVVDASVFSSDASAGGAPALDGHLGWLEKMLQAAEREYQNVWSAAPRRTKLCERGVCLARYYGEGEGQPPEVEFGHFATFYQQHAIDHGHCAPPNATLEGQRAFLDCVKSLERGYTAGEVRDAQIEEFFVNDRCVRESGHDTTFRWFVNGQERCTDFATVDLNALLLQYELDVAHLYLEGRVEHRGKAEEWCERARRRAALIRRYLWNETAGAYFDYDVEKKRQSSYLTATTLYPLWVNPDNECKVSLVSAERAQRLVKSALPQLESAGGLMASARESLAKVQKPTVLALNGSGSVNQTPERQWEAPNGWAPHQMLAWVGLRQHGYTQEAQRLAYRWLLLIAENAANYHGTVPEKFDVVARSHRVFAEYGNVGTEFSYIATEGFGWMNASFLVGLDVLTPEQRALLTALKPTASVFDVQD